MLPARGAYRGIASERAGGIALQPAAAFQRAVGAHRQVGLTGRVQHQCQRQGVQAPGGVEVAGPVPLRGGTHKRVARAQAQLGQAHGAGVVGQPGRTLQLPGRQPLRFQREGGQRPVPPRVTLQRAVQRQLAGELGTARVHRQAMVAFAAFGQRVQALKRQPLHVHTGGLQVELAGDAAWCPAGRQSGAAFPPAVAASAATGRATGR